MWRGCNKITWMCFRCGDEVWAVVGVGGRIESEKRVI